MQCVHMCKQYVCMCMFSFQNTCLYVPLCSAGHCIALSLHADTRLCESTNISITSNNTISRAEADHSTSLASVQGENDEH